MIFYDFEVFKFDWLVVFIDVEHETIDVIVNDRDRFTDYYNQNKSRVWIGFNSRHYDQYIAKAVLCGFDPKEVNDWIIVKDRGGWQFSNLFNQFQIINYDVMSGIDKGLKTFEGYMGHDIKESSVPFDIDRPLTQAEIDETIQYCRYDVEQTIDVFLQRQSDFYAQLNLVKIYDRPFSDMARTKVQLSANILGATKRTYNDEFDISFPPTLALSKYSAVRDWYEDKANRFYKSDTGKKNALNLNIQGVPHSFGWGGLHGAIDGYVGDGEFLMLDVESLYPMLMINYNLMSRSVPKHGFERFKSMIELRLKLKHEKKKAEQAPYKIVINGTYGGMKDKFNPLYDPRQANNVCVYGQLLLLDLIEKIEPYCQLIQSNTDGVLVKLNDGASFDRIDDVAYEWEQRTGLTLEFEEYSRVIQKDVNNYILVAPNGDVKRKGAWVKELSPLDYDLPIVNKAVVEYFIHGTPVETTIRSATDLIEFQQIRKISGKYAYLQHGDKILNERTVRVFADTNGELLTMHHKQKRTMDKVASTPVACRVVNDDITGVKRPPWIDIPWYVEMAHERVRGFTRGQ